MYFGFDELCLLPFHERKKIYSWPKVIYACKVFPWDLRQTGRAMRRYALVLSIPNAWLVGVAYPEPVFWNWFDAEISWKTKCNTMMGLLKVSKSQKQIMLSWILPKNERNSLSWTPSVLRIVSFVRFLEESRISYFVFEIYWPLAFKVFRALLLSI